MIPNHYIFGLCAPLAIFGLPGVQEEKTHGEMGDAPSPTDCPGSHVFFSILQQWRLIWTIPLMVQKSCQPFEVGTLSRYLHVLYMSGGAGFQPSAVFKPYVTYAVKHDG